ncbi:MAG: helix-turn-helix domain-containing protein [Armatimonadota bacterium]|nr:helix-turn-helix domain-containing protein [Armatimonadota bacterium]MDR7439121.1 helix-turn-helix domain-containing protein [Armatimonadota bacterium]MDR7562158.1 helix-turn-helix domain-containing protein [Armatimonadota bacterium]MDR7567105.1 helix-turn-helix domain-containing protein [Armatimonadota bacterium]MDR7602352.1 helix-turn-helix domain-containing protein [Armatimonadota bacterium]
MSEEARDRATAAAGRFAALGDPARLLALRLLARWGTLCVCQLQAALLLSQPTVSHHLKVLREAGLVEAQRRGPWVYYRIRKDVLKRLAAELLALL